MRKEYCLSLTCISDGAAQTKQNDRERHEGLEGARQLLTGCHLRGVLSLTPNRGLQGRGQGATRWLPDGQQDQEAQDNTWDSRYVEWPAPALDTHRTLTPLCRYCGDD